MKQKTACLGLFSAVAIILGYVESLVPVFAGIPGIKLGLANLGVLFILKKYSFREAALVSVVRILVIGFMFGNLFSILYSLAGAALSMDTVKRFYWFHRPELYDSYDTYAEKHLLQSDRCQRCRRCFP